MNRIKRLISTAVSLLTITSIVVLSFSTRAYAASSIKDKAFGIAGNASQKFGDTVNDVAGKAKETAGDLAKTATDVASNAGDIASKASSSAAEAASKATSGAESLGNSISSKAGDVASAASQKASEIGDAAVDTAQDVGAEIKAFVSKIDTKAFKNGWDYASKYAGVTVANATSSAYVASVQSAIEEMQVSMKDVVAVNRGDAQNAGFVAEKWHTDTYNIDAIASGSKNSAVMPESNKFGSADVMAGDAEYSLKYYKYADQSAEAQAASLLQKYNENNAHLRRHGKQELTIDEFLDSRGVGEYDDLMESMYKGQKRVIPADQLDDAKTYLENKIAKEGKKTGTNRQAMSKELQETLDSLADRVETKDGVSSKPLTKEEADAIAKLCKDGNFDPEDFGVTTTQMISSKYILKQAMGAGTQAAIVSAAFAIGPDIYSILVDAAKNGKVDEKALKDMGMDAAISGSTGFVEGSVSAAILTACQAGKFGVAFKDASPATIGTLTVLTIDAARYGYQLAEGQITEEEYGDIMAQEIFVAIASQATGALVQALLPMVPFAYVAGSMAGSMLASAGYAAGKEMILQVKGEGGFETVVPSTMKAGLDLGNNVIASISSANIVSAIKEMAVTTAKNGQILVNSVAKKGS